MCAGGQFQLHQPRTPCWSPAAGLINSAFFYNSCLCVTRVGRVSLCAASIVTITVTTGSSRPTKQPMYTGVYNLLNLDTNALSTTPQHRPHPCYRCPKNCCYCWWAFSNRWMRSCCCSCASQCGFVLVLSDSNSASTMMYLLPHAAPQPQPSPAPTPQPPPVSGGQQE